MIEQVNGLIYPMKEWDAVGKNDGKITETEKNGTKNLCSSQCLKIQYKMFMTHRRM